MKSLRPLKELMIDDKGCSSSAPGIGDIAYVKDLQTEKIVTTGYRCSIFGQFGIPGFGWHQMNACLSKPCSSGYAYLVYPGGRLQVDHHGAFSFSASGNHSGVTHDATAFVGCSQKRCCGCFGPVGGTDDYCTPYCTAKNGGTVVNIGTYTWFWVRSSLPKRVWNRCMEYKVKDENGNSLSYKLLDGNTTPEMGSCPNDETLLNEGIVVVPDGETAKIVPEVPGLMKYRKDNKELYVRSNDTWKVLAPEKKILKKVSDILRPKLIDVKERLHEQNKTVVKILTSDITQLESRLTNDMTQTKSGLTKDIAQTKSNLTSDISQVKSGLTDLTNTVSQIKSSLTSEITKVKSGLTSQLKTEMSQIAQIKQFVENVNSTLNTLLNNVKDPFSESVILSGEPRYRYQLATWVPVANWKTCWRATRDGWSASIFHSYCDNYAPTVTIVKVGNYIFGGFTWQSWSGNSANKQAPGSFIFSLRNSENLPPFIAPLKDQNNGYAITASSSNGPYFGCADLKIADNARHNINSKADFNDCYQAPSGVSDQDAILAGSRSFTPSEVEVFYFVH